MLYLEILSFSQAPIFAGSQSRRNIFLNTDDGNYSICLSYFFISSCLYSHYLHNRPHPCTTCQEDFASSEDLVQHLATRHDGAGIAASCDDVYRDSQLDKPFQCCNPGCGLYFKTLTGKSHCLTLNFHEVAPTDFCFEGCYMDLLGLNSKTLVATFKKLVNGVKLFKAVLVKIFLLKDTTQSYLKNDLRVGIFG